GRFRREVPRRGGAGRAEPLDLGAQLPAIPEIAIDVAEAGLVIAPETPVLVDRALLDRGRDAIAPAIVRDEGPQVDPVADDLDVRRGIRQLLCVTRDLDEIRSAQIVDLAGGAAGLDRAHEPCDADAPIHI